MKRVLNISLGIFLILLAPCIAIGSTYLYDIVKGQAGRQLAVSVYGLILSALSLYTGIRIIRKWK